MSYRFKDRQTAGRLLAGEVARRLGAGHLRIFALPRGGVPVAFEIAERLQKPLEIFVVRKLGVPGREEFAMGALASGDGLFLKTETIAQLGIPSQKVEEVIERETKELERLERLFGGSGCGNVAGETILLVDDGLATGATLRVAVAALRKKNPARIVVAVPVGAASSCAELAGVADEVICLYTPSQFGAVGEWYEDFSPTSEKEVIELLRRSQKPPLAGVGS